VEQVVRWLTTNRSMVKSLSKCEQEAIQALARAIVREAEDARDPEQEAAEKRSEDLADAVNRHELRLLEFYKHMTTLCAASIAGAAAVTRAFFSREATLWPLYIPLVLIGLALAFSGVSFGGISRSVGADTMFNEYWRDKSWEELVKTSIAGVRRHRIITLGTTIIWYVGLFTFVVAAIVLVRAPS
jgi:hypothetical protein